MPTSNSYPLLSSLSLCCFTRQTYIEIMSVLHCLVVPLDFGGVLHIPQWTTFVASPSYLSSIQKGTGGFTKTQQDTGYRCAKQDRIFRTCNRRAFWRCPQFLVGEEKRVVMGFRPDKGQWDFHIITLPLSYRFSVQEPPGIFHTFPSNSFGVLLGEAAVHGKADVHYCLKHACPSFKLHQAHRS